MDSIHPKYLKMGFVHYFRRKPKVIESDYEPMSFDLWKMFRDLEPSKFGLNYETYIRIKKEQYETKLESQKNVTLELVAFRYDLNEFELPHTKKEIGKIETDPLFEKWVQMEKIKEISNL